MIQWTELLSVWHLIRASGLIAYLILSFSALSGIACTISWIPPHLRTLMLHLHESCSRWSLWLVMVHASLLLIDTYVPYRFVEVIFPLLGPYRPWAVALGSLAAWLMLITLLAFDSAWFVGQKIWQAIHGANVVIYVAATLHGIWSGTDMPGQPWAMMYIGSALCIGTLVLLRQLIPYPNPNQPDRKLKGAN